MINKENDESSQLVNTDKGKGILVCSGNKQEDDGGVSRNEDEGNNGRLDDSENERALGAEDGF